MNLDLILTWTVHAAGLLLLFGGCFFMLTGATGIVRMPDIYTRLHPAGVADALGAPLVLLGLMTVAGWSLTSVKLFLLMLFLLVTSPTATHALAKAAFTSGLKPLGNVEA